MTGRHHSFPHLMTLLWAVGIAASVAGCGRTLVFAERDGVNLAIRANASSSPPIEVNFGLNRTIATIVPPAGESGGKPSGEAVNMFAGFQVEQPTSPDLAKPLDVDVQIITQFASGAAAKSVAGNPTVVARIVNINSTTFQRGPASVGTLEARQQLVATIGDLSNDQVVVAATSMLPNLTARPDALRKALAPQVAAIPPGGKMSPAMARNLLNQWAYLETVTPGTAAEWAAAFAQAKP
jgi:hypothetical protein